MQDAHRGALSIPFTRSTYPELAANAALVLIGVTCALLDRQLKTQAETFLQKGGFTENLYRARQKQKSRTTPN